MRGKALTYMNREVHKILKCDPKVRVVVLGDFNENIEKVLRHLSMSEERSTLIMTPIVGSSITRFPLKG